MSFTSNFCTNKKMRALKINEGMKINEGLFNVGENDTNKCTASCCIPVSEQILFLL